MGPYIKNNASDITYMSELPPLFRFAAQKRSKTVGVIRTYNLRSFHSVSYVLI